MPKPIYILGTGLSHDGSSCLMKDGKIAVAIEKERISRKKHDGGNDLLSVQYCLDAAGISVNDLSLVVQAANFEKDEIERDRYKGLRAFAGTDVPMVSISHHLAHAFSSLAVAPGPCAALVIDGCGSPYDQCDDLAGSFIPSDIKPETGLYCEKDSFYHFDGKELKPLYKDFALSGYKGVEPFELPTVEHSIGGMYSAASNYCFGNMDDAGKLMGLAPYGKGTGKPPIFILKEGRCFVDYTHFKELFTRPRTSYEQFKADFQYYADIAWWVQQETARAVHYIVKERMKLLPGMPLALSGGVVLNAVANAGLLQRKLVDELYIQPAAGDNGLAIGCACYGWMKLMGNEKPAASGHIFFGKTYDENGIATVMDDHDFNGGLSLTATKHDDIAKQAAQSLSDGKIIGWFQGGAEFGPRALGHRSILADPRLPDIQLYINRDVKNREDFRPFAPSVIKEHAPRYFEYAYDSPHMILTDRIRDEWKEQLKGIVHVDGSCRVQTVTADWNALYYELLKEFGRLSGIDVLLNTSFNTRGMPIVETPAEAIAMFCNSALDDLYINDYRIVKS